MSIKTMLQNTLIENTMTVSHFVRIYLNLKGKRTDNTENFLLRNNELRATNGVFYVQFAPRNGKYMSKPFVVTGDIFGDFRGRIRASSYEDFVSQAKDDLAIEWFVKYTNLSQKHFDLARENFLMNIPVCFDIVKYSEKIGTEKFRNAEMEELAQSVYKAKKEAKGNKCI